LRYVHSTLFEDSHPSSIPMLVLSLRIKVLTEAGSAHKKLLEILVYVQGGVILSCLYCSVLVRRL
jgi:hypothetical protein